MLLHDLISQVAGPIGSSRGDRAWHTRLAVHLGLYGLKMPVGRVATLTAISSWMVRYHGNQILTSYEHDLLHRAVLLFNRGTVMQICHDLPPDIARKVLSLIEPIEHESQ